MTICLSLVEFDHSVMVWSNFPLYNYGLFVFFSLLQLISNLWRYTLIQCKYPASLQNFPVHLAFIEASCSIWSFTMTLAKYWFSSSLTPHSQSDIYMDLFLSPTPPRQWFIIHYHTWSVCALLIWLLCLLTCPCMFFVTFFHFGTIWCCRYIMYPPCYQPFLQRALVPLSRKRSRSGC